MAKNLKPVAKAIIYKDDRILLQLRDNNPDIVYPNYWGLFGGMVETGETPEQAICREIQEELTWEPLEFKLLFPWEELETLSYTYLFSIPLTVEINQLTLTEGQSMSLFTFKELTKIHIIPKIPKMLTKAIELIDSTELSLAWKG